MTSGARAIEFASSERISSDERSSYSGCSRGRCCANEAVVFARHKGCAGQCNRGTCLSYRSCTYIFSLIFQSFPAQMAGIKTVRACNRAVQRCGRELWARASSLRWNTIQEGRYFHYKGRSENINKPKL